jgi:hypothetical protein
MPVTVEVGAGATHVSSWDEAWLIYDLWLDQDPERAAWKTKATINKLGVSPTGEENSYLVIAVVDGAEPTNNGGVISAGADGYEDPSWWGSSTPTTSTKGQPKLIVLIITIVAIAALWKLA